MTDSEASTTVGMESPLKTPLEDHRAKPATTAAVEKGTSQANAPTAAVDIFPQGYEGPASSDPHEAEGTNQSDVASLPPKMVVVEEPKYILHSLDSGGKLPDWCKLDDHDTKLLHKAHHSDPLGILGCHEVKHLKQEGGEKFMLVRAWIRNAREVRIRAVSQTSCALANENAPVHMHQRCDWLYHMAFEVKKEKPSTPPAAEGSSGAEEWTNSSFKYELLVKYHGDSSNQEFTIRDAYSFPVLLPDYDLTLFQSGSCWHVDNLFGSHIMEVDGVTGVRFAVWAPNSQFVSVVGDWNGWDGRCHPMRRRHDFGVWELFIPHLSAGLKYGYRIHSQDGKDVVKIDPYAQEFEVPPAYASIISACDDAYRMPQDRFKWEDAEWIKQRADAGKLDLVRRQPMSIYEVHLPSWMRGDDNSYIGYRDMADRLVKHVKNLNFTHVEFLPLHQHPYEPSWGYQITGLYAPYSRLGSPDDLKYLINELHKNGIGVFVDFVLAHFCKDEFGLVHYDGGPCYEYADKREGENLTWGTMVFNFRRNEVRSFLLGACYHWMRRYHVDGLRIDAVSAMLYKNYCREAGQWIANECGGDANFQAINLLQELNWVIHKEWPGVFTMAEESTSWQGVTKVGEGGLGFDAKWDLGWMNDTISYLTTPGYEKAGKHAKLTFRGLYVAHEKWILPLSHDEVVNGKGSLLDKCGFKGELEFYDRLRVLRSLFGFQVGLPGRPLIFMGGEIAQGREWKEGRSVDWHEGEEHGRKLNCVWLSDLLGVYKYHRALHAGDDESWNFKWSDCDNASDNIVAFIRSYIEWYEDVLVVCNFSSENYHRYPVGVSHGGEWQILLNSDDFRYGGCGYGPGNLSKIGATQGGRLGWGYCIWLDVPAFGCIYLQPPQPAKRAAVEISSTS